MNNTYREALEEYEQATGETFRNDLYPTPDSVPSDLLSVVRKVKLSQAHSRQMDIHYEMQAFRRSGGAVILPDDKKHLATEFEECRKQIEQWEGV